MNGSTGHIYPTVDAFKQVAEAANDADRLNKLVEQLRRGDGLDTRIHPFSRYSQEYKDCWKALFDRAKVINCEYYKGSRFPFQPKQ